MRRKCLALPAERCGEWRLLSNGHSDVYVDPHEIRRHECMHWERGHRHVHLLARLCSGSSAHGFIWHITTISICDGRAWGTSRTGARKVMPLVHNINPKDSSFVGDSSRSSKKSTPDLGQRSYPCARSIGSSVRIYMTTNKFHQIMS